MTTEQHDPPSPAPQNTPPIAVEPLRYTCELTLADIEGLRAFFAARIEEVRERHPFESNEHQTASCLQMALEHKFEPLVEAFRYGDDSRDVLDVKDRHWSALCMITLPWRKHPEFNADRWRSVRYRNIEHEAEMAVFFRSRLQ